MGLSVSSKYPRLIVHEDVTDNPSRFETYKLLVSLSNKTGDRDGLRFDSLPEPKTSRLRLMGSRIGFVIGNAVMLIIYYIIVILNRKYRSL